MPKATPEVTPEATPEAAPAAVEECICPKCGALTTYRCRLCGATRTLNSVSGNVIWMLNGSVVAAFQDEMNAWVRMATRHAIPVEQWPARFQGKSANNNSEE